LAGRRFANREPSIASQCGLVSAFQLRRGDILVANISKKISFSSVGAECFICRSYGA